MTSPLSEIVEFLSGIWRILAFLSLQGFVVAYLIRRFTSHSVALWAQRIDRQGATCYRFAVQNNEAVPLGGPGSLRVRLEGKSPRFVNAPLVFAGCKNLTSSMSPDRREWSLHFDSLPAYDSWTITCATSTQANALLVLSCSDIRPNQSTLRLGNGDASALVGANISPDPWLAALIVLASEAAYFLWVLFGLPHQGFRWADVGAALALAAFGAAVFVLIARKPHPVTQGYRKPSAVGIHDNGHAQPEITQLPRDRSR